MSNKKKILRQYRKDAVAPVGKLVFSTLFPNAYNLVDTFMETHRAQKKECFFEFLAGVAIDANTNTFSPEYIKKLQDELLDKENDQIISNILDSVFFSTNATCRLLLGVIARMYLDNDELGYADLILVIALKELLDDDLLAFKLFYAMEPVTSNMGDEICILDNYSMSQRITLEKLQNLNILGKDLSGARFGGGSLRFEKTTVSDILMEYLKIVELALDNNSK